MRERLGRDVAKMSVRMPQPGLELGFGFFPFEPYDGIGDGLGVLRRRRHAWDQRLELDDGGLQRARVHLLDDTRFLDGLHGVHPQLLLAEGIEVPALAFGGDAGQLQRAHGLPGLLVRGLQVPERRLALSLRAATRLQISLGRSQSCAALLPEREVGDVAQVSNRPKHDYTRKLWSAIPMLPGKRVHGKVSA